MLRRHMASTRSNKKRRGFTLIECVVSIAIFAIMGTMFASFMISSVRVVNLTLANDRDREALLEAISAGNPAVPGSTVHCDTQNGMVSIDTVSATGESLKLQIDVYNEPVALEHNYVRYTAPNKTVYHIYLGTNAIAVTYYAIQNTADDKKVYDALYLSKKEDISLQVTYRNETETLDPLTLKLSEWGNKVNVGQPDERLSKVLLEPSYGKVKDNTTNIEKDVLVYVRYRDENGKKSIIYLKEPIEVPYKIGVKPDGTLDHSGNTTP